jgi:hypothetical protein
VKPAREWQSDSKWWSGAVRQQLVGGEIRSVTLTSAEQRRALVICGGDDD